MPGSDKLTRDAKIIFGAAIDEITNANLKIQKIQKYEVASGFEAQISVNENAMKLKKITVQIEENHPLGRFMDIDIISSSKKQISREELFMPARKCFICGYDAKLCARSAKHSLEELLLFIHNKVLLYEKN